MKQDQKKIDFSLACPLPLAEHPRVLMAHGSGGRWMHQLIERLFQAAFSNALVLQRHDGAVTSLPPGRVAVTTDSYVIRPLFFPGGDIGMLAINGTVNDLAMCGARPLYLSASFILEEGLEMETLWRVVQSMRRAADRAGVAVITGDTKVVERGHGDGLYINTTGIGVVEHEQVIGPARVRPGDALLLSGDLGRHGMAVMAAREGLTFESSLESDTVALAAPVLGLVDAGVRIHCLRDATRGGLAAVLNEIATVAGVQIEVDENAIPVGEGVRGACEILGLDPLHVANEGCFVAFVDPEQGDQALGILKHHPPCRQAVRIGAVKQSCPQGEVILRTPIGGARILDMPAGELLPRIC